MLIVGCMLWFWFLISKCWSLCNCLLTICLYILCLVGGRLKTTVDIGVNIKRARKLKRSLWRKSIQFLPPISSSSVCLHKTRAFRTVFGAVLLLGDVNASYTYHDVDGVGQRVVNDLGTVVSTTPPASPSAISPTWTVVCSQLEDLRIYIAL